MEIYRTIIIMIAHGLATLCAMTSTGMAITKFEFGIFVEQTLQVLKVCALDKMVQKT